PGDKTRTPKGWRPQVPAPDIPKLIAEGYDPVHAAYIFVPHTTFVFSENVSRLPEMRTYAKEVGSAEEVKFPFRARSETDGMSLTVHRLPDPREYDLDEDEGLLCEARDREGPFPIPLSE